MSRSAGIGMKLAPLRSASAATARQHRLHLNLLVVLLLRPPLALHIALDRMMAERRVLDLKSAPTVFLYRRKRFLMRTHSGV